MKKGISRLRINKKNNQHVVRGDFWTPINGYKPYDGGRVTIFADMFGLFVPHDLFKALICDSLNR